MHITKNINIQVIKRTATNQYKIQFLPGKKKKTARDTEKRITEQDIRMKRCSTPLKHSNESENYETPYLIFREAKTRS